MRLNIGGGFTYCEGFTNVDICKDYLLSWLHPMIVYSISGTRKHHSYSSVQKVLRAHPKRHDVRSPLPYPDSSVEEIYTSHLLEHLTREDGIKFLRECDRVLTPGGILRIVTPDYDIVSTDNKEVLFNEFSDEWSRHKWVWSFDEVRKVFPTAEKLSFRLGNSTALSLDSMPEQSMYIEYRK